MLNGKTALITGANGGIGRSVVDIFLENGANVICMTRSKDIKFRNYDDINVISSDDLSYNSIKTNTETLNLQNKNSYKKDALTLMYHLTHYTDHSREFINTNEIVGINLRLKR